MVSIQTEVTIGNKLNTEILNYCSELLRKYYTRKAVTHPTINQSQRCLTQLIRQ